MERDCSAENKLRAMANPKSVEWEIAEPIKAFFLAINNGEMSPQVRERKSVPKSAYRRKSYCQKSFNELMSNIISYLAKRREVLYD